MVSVTMRTKKVALFFAQTVDFRHSKTVLQIYSKPLLTQQKI